MGENLKAFLIAAVLVICHKQVLLFFSSSKSQHESLQATGQLLLKLDSLGVVYPEVVLAQALHETNMFRSQICKENKNLFGMKQSSRDYDIGVNRGHAKYAHKQHKGKCNMVCYLPSILDYRDWQRQMMPLDKIKTRDEYIYYLQHLPNGMAYAEDKKYPERLRFYLKLMGYE